MHDKDIAIRYLFLGMAKNVIQQDIKNIQNGPFKIKDFYIDQLEKMHSLATNERRKLNKIMWDKRISIINLGRDGNSTNFKLIYNSKEEISRFNNDVIKKHVRDILVELMEEGE